MEIKVLGPGCTNCTTLEKRARQALELSGIDATIEKVTDFAEIASYGIMATPGLVVDEQVVASGRVPKVDEIQSLLAGT
jgi:small redox-active disulfide protein 2